MLRVIALSEDLGKAATLWGRLHALPGVELEVLISDNAARSSWRRLARLPWQALRLRGAARRDAWNMWRSGRLTVTGRALHAPETIAWLAARRADVGLHAAGVIYRKPLLDAFRLGVLNPHIGLLPLYRGRSVMEWSLLQGDPTGVTTFFMDEGIDTGPHIVLREAVPVDHLGSIAHAKAHLFGLDGEMYARALMALQAADYVPMRQTPEEGKRFYVMSGLFSGVVDRWLKERAANG